MINIGREHIIHTMSEENKPAAYCESGDVVTFQTYDCYGNKLLPENAIFGVDNPRLSNPATGPLFVKGAIPGDTLKVEILDILVGPLGVNVIGPSCECFINKLSEYEIRRMPVEGSLARLSNNLLVPIEPMIGVIGVAPKDTAIPTVLPGNHGGNMDCRQIKKGAVLYLPVFTEGALLALGDIHALMGDGEISENGLEIEGTAIVRISVLSGYKRKAPAVFVDNKWITIASRNTLDEAAEEATSMMYDFLIDEVGMDAYDAGLLLGLCSNLIVCQKCNMYKTVRMEFSLDYLDQTKYIPA